MSKENHKKHDFNNKKENLHGTTTDCFEENVETEDIENKQEHESEQETTAPEDQIIKLTEELDAQKEATEKEKKEYLFLMAEFDNFRKRTLREKSEIIKNAGEHVFKGLLPIIDDFERGIQATDKTDDIQSVKEGMILIYNKLKKYLEQNGVKEMDPEDCVFDTEKHEAISVVSVQEEDQKGKILDTVEKGYTINDKVLRHAKVVVGQ